MTPATQMQDNGSVILRLDTLLGFVMWWVLGWVAAGGLLVYYERVRWRDFSKQEDPKGIERTITKVSLQAGLVIAMIWLMVDINAWFEMRAP